MKLEIYNTPYTISDDFQIVVEMTHLEWRIVANRLNEYLDAHSQFLETDSLAIKLPSFIKKREK